MNPKITSKVEDFLGEKILSANAVSGGCIAESRIIKTESGKQYFLKTHSGAPGMFMNEANGLNELAKPQCIRVPNVILAHKKFLLIEYIQQGAKNSSFFKDFGTAFANMHKFTSDKFGFFEDNYIGSNPQYNVPHGLEKTDWAEFYFQNRILAQYKMAEENGYATNDLKRGINQLEGKIHEILSGSEEPPTLLHGDLWSGNFMCDNNGKAVLIDPAVYYGHREADLAMTKMFGGFSYDFYTSYQQTYPLKDGWEYREKLYLLYHYMNHLNLFGTSYYNTSVSYLWSYLR
jgi:protein-ribulosamine 3-kinase